MLKTKNKYNFINEIIKHEFDIISEAFRGFSFSKFKKINDPIERYKYAKSHLPKIGQGSSRVVFGLGAGKVLKLIGDFEEYEYYLQNIETFKNDKYRDPKQNERYVDVVTRSTERGFAQNKEEVSLFTNPKIKPVVAKIYNFADDYSWIVSEAVRETSFEEFGKITGIKFPLYVSIISLVEDNIANFFDVKKIIGYMLSYSTYNTYNSFDKYKTPKEKTAEDYLERIISSDFIQGIFSLIKNGIVVGDLRALVHYGVTTSGNVVLLDYGLTENSYELYL